MSITIFEAAYHGNRNEVEALIKKNSGIVNKLFDDNTHLVLRGLSNVVWYGKKISAVALVAALAIPALLQAPTRTEPGEEASAAAFLFGTSYAIYTQGDKNLYPYTVSRKGWTPLHFAAAGDQKAIAMLLLQNKADPTKRDIANKTFLDIAKELGHKEFVTACTAILDVQGKFDNDLNQLLQQNNELRKEVNQAKKGEAKALETSKKMAFFIENYLPETENSNLLQTRQ